MSLLPIFALLHSVYVVQLVDTASLHPLEQTLALQLQIDKICDNQLKSGIIIMILLWKLVSSRICVEYEKDLTTTFNLIYNRFQYLIHLIL